MHLGHKSVDLPFEIIVDSTALRSDLGLRAPSFPATLAGDVEPETTAMVLRECRDGSVFIRIVEVVPVLPRSRYSTTGIDWE